jgi:hypothetical protein
VVLVAVSVGLLGFGAAAVDVGVRARQELAVMETGATTVAVLGSVHPSTLLAKVRTVDPDGRYAMAVAPVPASIPVLAVDATRLAAVATWRPDAGIDPAELGRLLHPPARDPLVIRADGVSLEIENEPSPEAGARSLVLSLEPLTGESAVDVSSGNLKPGRHTYELPVSTCVQGCRISGFRILLGTTTPTRPLRVTLLRIGGIGSGTPLVSPDDLADPTLWMGLNGASIEAGRPGLVVSGFPSSRDSLRVAVVDAPNPVPLAATKALSGLRTR